jgi:hypothetical protein
MTGFKATYITNLKDTSTVDSEGVGALRWEGNKCYKWVKYAKGAGSVAAVAGNVVYYYGVSADAVTGGYENNVVTMDITDGYLGAGVLQAIIADGSFGWIQVKGPATLTTALTAGADGNPLTHIGTTDGTLDVVADGEADTSAIVAWATDISAKKIVCDFPF